MKWLFCRGGGRNHQSNIEIMGAINFFEHISRVVGCNMINPRSHVKICTHTNPTRKSETSLTVRVVHTFGAGDALGDKLMPGWMEACLKCTQITFGPKMQCRCENRTHQHERARQQTSIPKFNVTKC